jgi:hypothetical protein
MKEVLRAAGVPCARHALVATVAEARAFAAEVGYPVVVKPPAGAGSVATFRVERDDQLERAVLAAAPDPGHPALVEEFVVGDEHSLETVSVDGRAVWHSLTRYYPTPLEATRHPWIQWCVVLPREVDDARYDDIRRVGAEALAALGMTTGLTHMEWFRRRDGARRRPAPELRGRRLADRAAPRDRGGRARPLRDRHDGAGRARLTTTRRTPDAPPTPMNVLFIAPGYPDEMPLFVRGLSRHGARVFGLGDVPEAQLPELTRRHLSGYVQADIRDEAGASRPCGGRRPGACASTASSPSGSRRCCSPRGCARRSAWRGCATTTRCSSATRT